MDTTSLLRTLSAPLRLVPANFLVVFAGVLALPLPQDRRGYAVERIGQQTSPHLWQHWLALPSREAAARR